MVACLYRPYTASFAVSGTALLALNTLIDSADAEKRAWRETGEKKSDGARKKQRVGSGQA